MTKDNRMTISLKAARINAGLTQKEAAVRMGINRMTVSAWEAGEQDPRPWRRPVIAAVYGLPEDAIAWKEF